MNKRRDHLRGVQRPPTRVAGSRRARQGVTLLEVLFSIGIVAVGLLGVLIIVPLAGSRSAQGMIADGADRMGRNAIRLFDIHHMRHPNMWTRLNRISATTHQYQPYGAQWTGATRRTYLWQQTSSLPLQARAFCIDPLFIANERALAVTNSTAVPAGTMYFPYYEPGHFGSLAANLDPRLDRISLYPRFSSAGMTDGTAGMTVEQAVSVFMGEDDLLFKLQEDRTLLPEQVFDSALAKRQFEGKFSWLATVVPVYASFRDEVNLLPDRYVLSIVVFHRRDLSLTDQGGALSEPDNERLVLVSQFHSEGYGGGDVQLQTHPNRPVSDLEVKDGQWAMLSAMVNISASATPIVVPVFRWYRVMATDGIEGTGPFTRNVTLQGLDWNDVFGLSQLTPNRATPTQVTLLNGVVAVYEKTIHLETSSLWTGL